MGGSGIHINILKLIIIAIRTKKGVTTSRGGKAILRLEADKPLGCQESSKGVDVVREGKGGGWRKKVIFSTGLTLHRKVRGCCANGLSLNP